MSELAGEKIDIIDFDEDPARFVANALSPSKVVSVQVIDAATRAARVIVPISSCPWRSARKARTPGWPPGSPGGGSTSAATPPPLMRVVRRVHGVT